MATLRCVRLREGGPQRGKNEKMYVGMGRGSRWKGGDFVGGIESEEEREIRMGGVCGVVGREIDRWSEGGKEYGGRGRGRGALGSHPRGPGSAAAAKQRVPAPCRPQRPKPQDCRKSGIGSRASYRDRWPQRRAALMWRELPGSGTGGAGGPGVQRQRGSNGPRGVYGRPTRASRPSRPSRIGPSRMY